MAKKKSLYVPSRVYETPINAQVIATGVALVGTLAKRSDALIQNNIVGTVNLGDKLEFIEFRHGTGRITYGRLREGSWVVTQAGRIDYVTVTYLAQEA